MRKFTERNYKQIIFIFSIAQKEYKKIKEKEEEKREKFTALLISTNKLFIRTEIRLIKTDYIYHETLLFYRKNYYFHVTTYHDSAKLFRYVSRCIFQIKIHICSNQQITH